MRRLALAALAGGVAVAGASLVMGQVSAVLAALAASWLCFTGIGAGALAFSAAVRLSRGRWAGQALPAAEAAGGFLWPSFAILVAVVGFARAWVPGLAQEGVEAWIALSLRSLIAGGALALAGSRYLAALRNESPRTAGLAALYLLIYVTTLSLWAVDFVMGLTHWAPSTVIPPLYFMGAFLSGIAWTSLAQAARGEMAELASTRHDLARLLFAFCIFWGYLAWAAYLPTWYGNLPEETGLLTARWDGGWRFLTLAVIASVFAFPFFLLLPEAGKRGSKSLGIGAVSILAGLAGERFLLVVPSIESRVGAWTVISMLGSTALMLGAFVFFATPRGIPHLSDRTAQ